MHEMAITESVVAAVSERVARERVNRVVLEIGKVDLLPHLAFDVAAFLQHAHHVNPKLRVFQVSAQTGEGIASWYDWLRELRQGAAAIEEELR